MFGIAFVDSIAFILGLWLFTHRYLVTSIELNYLFTNISIEKLQRLD